MVTAVTWPGLEYCKSLSLSRSPLGPFSQSVSAVNISLYIIIYQLILASGHGIFIYGDIVMSYKMLTSIFKEV